MNSSKPKKTFFLIITILVAILLGGAAGYMIKNATTSSPTIAKDGTSQKTGGSSAYGTKDTKLYPDSATGTLREGGIEGEGTHRIERPGGPSQNVYVTSSTIDLGTLEGKKITVWGKTYASTKAGWLMDVGYVEVK